MSNELKPVRCGCGGDAVPFPCESGYSWNRSKGYCVECVKCKTKTSVFETLEKAIETWNNAMGKGKTEIAITKGTWMVVYDGLYCSVCNCRCETTALPDVCPHCGTCMHTADEWSL